jgi:hypothetical protein
MPMLLSLAQQFLSWAGEHWFQVAVLASTTLIATRLLSIQYTIQLALSGLGSALTYDMRRILENSGSGMTSLTHDVGRKVEQSGEAVVWKLDEILREMKHSAADIDASIQGLQDQLKGAAYDLEKQLEVLDLNWRR